MFRSNKLPGALLIATLFTVQSNFAQSPYRFQHFGTKDGLVDNFVWSIAQDSLGYMWFQYFAGLSRFDGYNFKVYKYDRDDSLRSSLDFLFGGLRVDANKNILVTKFGPSSHLTLARYDRKTDGFIKVAADLATDSINRYWLDKNCRTLWVSLVEGKGVFALDMESKQMVKYLNPSSDKETYIQQNTVFDSEDMGSSILFATRRGLWSFEKATRTFRRPPCNPKDSAFLYNTTFFHVGPNIHGPKDKFWVSIPGGMVQLRSDLSVLQRMDYPPDFNRTVFDIDAEGVIWFGTSAQGLYRFNPEDDSFINIRNVPGDPYSLKSNRVIDVTVDRDQNIWVATGTGLSKLPRKTIESANLNDVTGASPGGIYKTSSKEFIVAGQFMEDPPLYSSEILLAQILPGQLDSLHFTKLFTIKEVVTIMQFLQGKHYFWTSTYGSGIFGFSINPKSEVIETGTPLHVRHDPANPNTISTNLVGVLWEDAEENLWAGSDHGLIKISHRIPYGEKGSVRMYQHVEADTNSINDNGVAQIYPEDEKSFWVVTLTGVDLFHRDTENFEHVFGHRESTNNLYRTSDGKLYLGTIKGLYEATNEQGHYRFDNPPLWDRSEVKDIQEDQHGRLWMRTSIGLICYNRMNKIAIEFNEDDGMLHLRGYQVGWLHQTSHGVIFTLDNGITLFDPMTFQIEKKKPNPVLTRLEVNSNAPVVGKSKREAEDFLITKDISVLDELTMDYQHNNFTIEFSAMEMTAPEKNLYRHKLEGFDNDWIETDFRNRTATYTNLDAGHYTFKVKASNHHGIWSDQETTLTIIVLPPPWKTSWAYTGYGVLVVGLLFLARKTIVQRERLKSNLKLAKVEQEKEHFELEKAKEVDKVKSTFFANISHEFRTPLTLIKGPVAAMLDEYASNPKTKEQLRLVQRNSDLLLKLINQLLDLAKLESGSLTVEVSNNNLNLFLAVLTNSFSSLALQKDIRLIPDLPSIRYLARFDKDKVETILINLINNAIKFTPPGGNVNVRVSLESPDNLQTANKLILSVSDTGIGIETDQQEKVFERFYQVSEAHKEVGTGIGLSLVRELVALMKGTLSLQSEPGRGSEFTVILPLEIIRVLSETEDGIDYQELIAPEELLSNGNELETELDSRPRVLVVEDNGDLRKFIIDCLGKEFHFLEAADGKQGMQKAFEEVPDLIVSDVMMPEMDGITMTGKLKKDTRTSHIPLILLTAKTSDESKLFGLGTGADDYLTKPFNKNELLLKVRNSIALRVKLREKIKLELLKESPKVEVQSADEQFLWNVKEAIMSRLGNDQLGVESLAEEIGLSRSQLLRKITALTGVSVNELIRTFRLQKAAQLLEQNWGPVTQVAYEVGFSNLSYFSKVFKEQYGVLPSEYATKVQ